MTGLGDRVIALSSIDSSGEASSRGSLAGLLTLCLRFERGFDPLTWEDFSAFDFLFFFLFNSPSTSDLRLRLPMACTWSEELDSGIFRASLSSSLARRPANWTILSRIGHNRWGRSLTLTDKI